MRPPSSTPPSRDWGSLDQISKFVKFSVWKSLTLHKKVTAGFWLFVANGESGINIQYVTGNYWGSPKYSVSFQKKQSGFKLSLLSVGQRIDKTRWLVAPRDEGSHQKLGCTCQRPWEQRDDHREEPMCVGLLCSITCISNTYSRWRLLKLGEGDVQMWSLTYHFWIWSFFHDHFYLHMSLFKSFLPNTKLSVCFFGDCQKAGMDVWYFLHFCAS